MKKVLLFASVVTLTCVLAVLVIISVGLYNGTCLRGESWTSAQKLTVSLECVQVRMMSDSVPGAIEFCSCVTEELAKHHSYEWLTDGQQATEKEKKEFRDIAKSCEPGQEEAEEPSLSDDNSTTEI